MIGSMCPRSALTSHRPGGRGEVWVSVPAHLGLFIDVYFAAPFFRTGRVAFGLDRLPLDRLLLDRLLLDRLLLDRLLCLGQVVFGQVYFTSCFWKGCFWTGCFGLLAFGLDRLLWDRSLSQVVFEQIAFTGCFSFGQVAFFWTGWDRLLRDRPWTGLARHPKARFGGAPQSEVWWGILKRGWVGHP